MQSTSSTLGRPQRWRWKKSIKHVMINTNGIRISIDESFVSNLASLNPIIYLQFDGFRKETYEKIRGKDLKEAKMKAIENMEKYGIRIVLVCTVQRNVNEVELGNLVDFALSRKSVRGIVFQPTFYSGRHPDVDPLDVVTLPEVVKLVTGKSRHGLQDSDFVPTPCCYPTCNSSCYVYVYDKEVKPLARTVNVEEYLEYFMNRSVADLDQLKGALQVLTSFECCSGGRGRAKAPSSMSNNTSMNCCSIPMELKGIEENVKVIMVQSFMDPFNFDIKRLIKCCIHEITPQGKIVPICAFNNIPKYREEMHKYYLDKRKLDTHISISEG